MDAEWLAILRATHHAMSRSPNDLRLPMQRVPVEGSDVMWVQNRLKEHKLGQRQVGEWPASF
jgi:hypothetical protein